MNNITGLFTNYQTQTLLGAIQTNKSNQEKPLITRARRVIKKLISV